MPIKLPSSVGSTSVVLPVPSGSDDGAAINALIAASAPGAHIVRSLVTGAPYSLTTPLVLLPGRSYDFRAPPWMNTGLEPGASGTVGSTFKQANGANLDYMVATPAVLGTGASPAADAPLRVQGLTLDGNRANQTSGKGHGLGVACWGSSFRDITVLNCRGHGISQVLSNAGGNAFVAANGNGYENSYTGHIKISNCGGYGFYSGPMWTDCTINGHFIASVIGLGGINIANGAGWSITGTTHLWNIATDGLQVTGGYATEISGVYVEGFGAAVSVGQSGTNNPWVYGAYAAGTTYSMYQLVTSGGSLYYSLIDGNIGNTPASSPTQWQTVNLGPTAVYGIAAWALGTDRPVNIHDCKVSLGHNSINTISGINYRAYIIQGPAAGNAYINFHDNTAGNEYANGQAATAMAYRVAKQAGGLNVGGMVISAAGTATNRKIGTFSTADSIDASVASWTAV